MAKYVPLDAITSPVTRVLVSLTDPKPGLNLYQVWYYNAGRANPPSIFGIYRSQRIAGKKVDRIIGTAKLAYVLFIDKTTGQPYWIDDGQQSGQPPT